MKRYQILLPLILLAFFLRVWQLPQTPPGLWYDEAYYSMDAAWLLDGGPWRLFFVGNNGREPIFIYLQTIFVWIFGANPLASRLLAPLIGTLTIPLVYVLARRLSRQANWLTSVPYLAAAGMAISFWHLGLSRGGYRGVLLPLVALVVFYTFWRGWQARSLKYMILAGLFLGLSQYTYLAARVFPLIFGLFAVVWSVLHRSDRGRLKSMWLMLLIMAVISVVIFAPLGWIFYQEPELFSARTGDVIFTPDTPAELVTHLVEAVRLFIDGGDPNWRHHLPGRPMLGWLGWLGFWPGLIVCLRNFRRPHQLFLITALLVLYLPALISVPPVHALRLSALLPIYYIIFALGLLTLTRWSVERFGDRSVLSPPVQRWVAVIIIVVMSFEGGLTFFDYFYRWASAEETYVEYNGPLVDFVNTLIDQTHETPVIIPFQLYVHPTTRYLLHDHFSEQPAPPTLSGPIRLVSLPHNFRMLNVANIPPLPSFVWLTQQKDQGAAYVSRPPRASEQAYLNMLTSEVTPELYQDRYGRELAQIRSLADPTPLVAMFTDPTPRHTVDLNWANLARLVGYEITPELIQPGQPLTLNLYWQSLTDQTFEYRLFLQLIDGTGQPINQWEGEAFREDMYRWRPDGLLPTQHTLWVGPDTPPGPYLVRMGFFDAATGERLSLQADENGSSPGDQVELGLFYVSAAGTDPRQPARPLGATFGNAIKLIGVTLPEIQHSSFSPHHSPLTVTFHWQALRPTDQPYTVFLQLLDEQGNLVQGWDRQPFNGLYPPQRWSPGEVVVDTFHMPLPEAGLSPGMYRLITGFYEAETGQRLRRDDGSDFAELATFEVE